mmetsp:Transcript_3647/g.10488  ORF Transcript_3647/g.10488 Transcript_3647/m.10488 type:complete len:216 (-) Transcript_3647:1354-2001(-)
MTWRGPLMGTPWWRPALMALSRCSLWTNLSLASPSPNSRWMSCWRPCTARPLACGTRQSFWRALSTSLSRLPSRTRRLSGMGHRVPPLTANQRVQNCRLCSGLLPRPSVPPTGSRLQHPRSGPPAQLLSRKRAGLRMVGGGLLRCRWQGRPPPRRCRVTVNGCWRATNPHRQRESSPCRAQQRCLMVRGSGPGSPRCPPQATPLVVCALRCCEAA